MYSAASKKISDDDKKRKASALSSDKDSAKHLNQLTMKLHPLHLIPTKNFPFLLADLLRLVVIAVFLPVMIKRKRKVTGVLSGISHTSLDFAKKMIFLQLVQ